jgi:spermidine synthase
VTAGAVSLDPSVEQETIVEIEPIVPQTVSTYFSGHNNSVATNPKVTVRIDDGRHFLLTTRERFDAITSDPLDPWVKGAATLYTQEFFELVKSRLTEGGVFTLFVQLYESNAAAVKSEIATFFAVFPQGMVFANTQDGVGYDLVLLGQAGPTVIDVDAVAAKLARPEMAAVARSLREVGIGSATDLFATFAGQATDLATWLSDAAINHDRDLRLQYLAGLGLNLYASGTIYADMEQAPFRFPTDVFRGSDKTLQTLEQSMRDARP